MKIFKSYSFMSANIYFEYVCYKIDSFTIKVLPPIDVVQLTLEQHGGQGLSPPTDTVENSCVTFDSQKVNY